MVKFTERDVAIVAGLAGAADFLTEGRFSAPVARALKRVFRRAAPPVARTLPRLGMTALQVGKQIALRHPVLTAGAVVYYTYKNRDEIGALVEQGYEVVQDIQESGAFSPTKIMQTREEFIASNPEEFHTIPFTDIKVQKRPGDITRLFPVVKRKPSSFNKAIKAGMKAVKKSKSYGGIGKISPATKVFAIVTKLASAKKKKKKAPKSGIRRKIWGAMKGLR